MDTSGPSNRVTPHSSAGYWVKLEEFHVARNSGLGDGVVGIDLAEVLEEEGGNNLSRLGRPLSLQGRSDSSRG